MSSKYVLYAEDDENDAFFLKRGFKRAGITDVLIVVPDGQETIDYCSGTGRFSNRVENPHPSLVLLDLNMPKKLHRSVEVDSPGILLTDSPGHYLYLVTAG